MGGLRERKKGRTREAIQREALRLIAEQAYEATTCEQIAAAAEVSPATLFRYFPTKEDIVLQDGYDPLIAAAIVARPSGEPALVAVRRGFADAFAEVYDVEAIRQRTALILSVPALRSRSREQGKAWSRTCARLWSVEALVTTPCPSSGRGQLCCCGLGCRGAVGHTWGDLPALADEAFAALGDLAGGRVR